MAVCIAVTNNHRCAEESVKNSNYCEHHRAAFQRLQHQQQQQQEQQQAQQQEQEQQQEQQLGIARQQQQQE